MDCAHLERLDCENAQNLAQKALPILLEMAAVVLKHAQEELQLILGHGLDNVLLVMTEEEETTAASFSSTRLEDLLEVFTRTQRLLDLFNLREELREC